MKKKLLFVMNNIKVGGAEKALVSLLQAIDYSVYEVDLFLFEKEGLLLNGVPSEVNILPAPEDYKYFEMPIGKAISGFLKKGRLKAAAARILFGYIYKTEKNPSKKEQRSWKYLSMVLPKLPKKYDVSIGYLEKRPNYFCIDKTSASRKIGFIHNDYEKLEMDAAIDRPYFKKFDAIATVSDECKVVLEQVFPEFKNKFHMIGNVILPSVIRNMALVNDEPLPPGLKIFTLGRLVPQKGYDIAIEAAGLLKSKGMKFKWYILGEGELETELKALALEKGVSEEIVFLGTRENPYALLGKADIYVQPSRFEGYGIAIAEAKILGIPTVLTRFNLAEHHIDHGVNGLISGMEGASLAEQLGKLSGDEVLRESFRRELLASDYGTVSEMHKLYELF